MSSQPKPGVLERLATREFSRNRQESHCEELERSVEAERARALRIEGHARTLATQLLQREAQIRDLEAQLAALRSATLRDQQQHVATSAHQAAQLEEAVRRAQSLESTVTELRGQLVALATQRARAAAADAPAVDGPNDALGAELASAAPGAPDTQPQARLCVVLERLDAPGGPPLLVRGRTRIGRTPDNDLQINARYVSRRHAVIVPGPDSAFVQDLGSTNGVLVNGQRVRCARIMAGDVLCIGAAQFRLGFVPAEETEVP